MLLPMLRVASWLVAVAGVAGQQPCKDSGPWPCNEEGCPAPSISCERLKKNCESTFADVWRVPPAGLENALVKDQCPAACGVCQSGAAQPGGESKCVSWRQTSECSANGKRRALRSERR